MLKRWLLLTTLLIAGAAFGAPVSQVILVTADGLRWQEVFRGADERLLRDERFAAKDYSAFPSYQSGTKQAARSALMPFFWDTLSVKGSTIGNRDQRSLMRVTNPWWFSYPGYNEILTGRADPRINSNDKRPNPNVTVLEWLNRQRGFTGKVQAFGSWDVFPYIINAERSGVPVNAGFMPVTDRPTERERFLNELQIQLPALWPTVRVDALTHQYALEALRSRRPRVVYISYGETDDFAHDGHYAQYLAATHRFDGFLRELWRTIQSDRFYKDRTVLLVTTDHGRGEQPLDSWQHHSSAEAVRASPTPIAGYENGIVGSDQIWFAAIGPGIAAHGNVETEPELTQSQVAATLLRALGIERSEFDPQAAAALDAIFR